MTRTIVVLCCLSACGTANPGGDMDACASLEQRLRGAIDAAASDATVTADPDLTLLLEADDGRRFSHSHGSSSAVTAYESASTSKLVAAVVLLDLVDQGALSLDSKPHDLIAFWTGESAITLRHLLSFRSGFNLEPLCLNGPAFDFEGCVQIIYNNNVGVAPAPGAQFYYASTHLQIAGLMAAKVVGKSWSEIFAAWQARTGLMPAARFDLPSATNPRLAGGMHWTGEEYLALLRALDHGTVLGAASRAELFANQRGSATVASSPIIAAYNEDWAYGLGNWLECPTAVGPDTFDCGAGHRNSSPGAYGAYPFIDFERRYFGVLARQGALGSFTEGLAVFRAVEGLADEWAASACGQP